jgi:acrylyl-CoA reductase (NADPH)
VSASGDPDRTTVLLLERDGDGPVRAAVHDLPPDRLPGGAVPAAGEVAVAVSHSSLNYKDALVVTGTGGPLVRDFPHVPGIDLAGTVTAVGPEVDPGVAAVGDEVLVTGCWLGERRWGGMATRAHVPAAWLVRRPTGLDAAGAMALGTAGFTARLCVDALERGGVTPGTGPVLVTGATGGVGSLAVHLLARAGHTVVAATGTPDAEAWLRRLGATEVVARSELEASATRPLASARWAGAIDVAGGATLAGALVATAPHGVVAACGIAGGRELTVSLAPFFARGVVLAGIDSVLHPMPERPDAWARLAAGIDPGVVAGLTRTIGLAEVPAAAAELLAGGLRGRTVVATG